MRSRILEDERISSTRTVVFVHDAYGIGNSLRNISAAKRIREEGIASTIMYESSRDWEKYESARTPEDWIAAFDGKRYQDEVTDLLDVLDYVKIANKPSEIFVSGTSYGASLALLAADQFPGITRLFLSAPQVTTKEHKDIYQGFPGHKRFREILHRFEGNLGVLVGGFDAKHRLRDAHFILDNAATSMKRLYIAHANHNFGDGPENNQMRQVYIDWHVRSFGTNGK
jgi:dienelactone hydrolase